MSQPILKGENDVVIIQQIIGNSDSKKLTLALDSRAPIFREVREEVHSSISPVIPDLAPTK